MIASLVLDSHNLLRVLRDAIYFFLDLADLQAHYNRRSVTVASLKATLPNVVGWINWVHYPWMKRWALLLAYALNYPRAWVRG